MDTICHEHLNQINSLNQTSIKCLTCHRYFLIGEQIFEANNTLRKLLDDEVFLSDDEKQLKRSLQSLLNEFFHLYEEFYSITSQHDLTFHEHFQDLRFKLDLHREKLKENIDDIYMEMIEQTKKVEASYVNSLNTNKTFLKEFDLEKEQFKLEEIFREPNLLITTIKKMQSEQEENIARIKWRLDKMNESKYLVKSNSFKPCLSLDITSFGLLTLIDYSNLIQQSEILQRGQLKELLNLCEFNSNEKFSLLYRASRDGFKASDFHSRCDGKPKTLTLIKVANKPFVFGGYASVCWSRSNQYKSDSNAFIFSLINKDNMPCKMKTTNPIKSICCQVDCGPIFGEGHEIYVANHSNLDAESHSSLCQTYKNERFKVGSNEATSFLAGSYKFRISEIEVYKKD
jgi:hypothetical protein